MPAGVRRRLEFLNKNLFVYLAAAVVLATLLPLFLLSRASAESAESDLKKRQQRVRDIPESAGPRPAAGRRQRARKRAGPRGDNDPAQAGRSPARHRAHPRRGS
jgi:hypothetical protein